MINHRNILSGIALALVGLAILFVIVMLVAILVSLQSAPELPNY